MRAFVLCLLVTGCVTQEERECMDYKTIKYDTVECIPLYGNLICNDTVKTSVVCIRYEEALKDLP